MNSKRRIVYFKKRSKARLISQRELRATDAYKLM